MKTLLLLTALSAPVLLSGCIISVDGERNHASSEWEAREYNNREHISKLKTGTSFETVLTTMGVADFNELYERNDGVVRVLYYRTNRAAKDGITTKQECTPLVFKNGMLVGWGDKAYSMM